MLVKKITTITLAASSVKLSTLLTIPETLSRITLIPKSNTTGTMETGTANANSCDIPAGGISLPLSYADAEQIYVFGNGGKCGVIIHVIAAHDNH